MKSLEYWLNALKVAKQHGHAVVIVETEDLDELVGQVVSAQAKLEAQSKRNRQRRHNEVQKRIRKTGE